MAPSSPGVAPAPSSFQAIFIRADRSSVGSGQTRRRLDGVLGSLQASVSFAVALCCVFMLSGLLLLHFQHSITASMYAVGSGSRRGGRGVVAETHQVPAPHLPGRKLYEAVEQHHPLNRLKCGNWAAEYAALHARILSGDAPQRYAVMRSRQEFGNGLADRLATSVTIFMYALLTNRAFQYDWDPPVQGGETEQATLQQQHYGKFMYFEPPTHLWEGLRSDFIDWRYTGADVGNSSVVMDYNCDKDTDVYKAMFAKQDVSALHDGVHTVVWHADHAMVYSAFDNPYIGPKLTALGLQRDTAFACMFDFLYRPTPEVLDMFRPQLPSLLDPSALKIGIQIRVGDWQLCDSYLFKPQSYPSLFDHYFQCAAEIEADLAAPGQRVVWFTLADLPALRTALAARHAPRILVNTHVSVEHIVKSRNASRTGFLQAVGELWMFSLTSVHVITRKSGFGKVPAMLNANGSRHIFTVDYPVRFLGGLGLDNRKVIGWAPRNTCTTQHATPLEFVCNDFTGI